jgi:hypothetical protein
MRRADARSAQIGGPDSISQSLQVSTYSSEPLTASRARNLFAKRDCRLSERDEVAKDGPEVTLVGFAFTLAGLAEWLTGATACPNRSRVWPAGESECERPAADSGEKVLLCVSGEFMRRDVLY